MSQISQLSKHAISYTVSITVSVVVTLLPQSLPQLPQVPQQPNHMVYHIILWLVDVVPFPTSRKGVLSFFLAWKHFLLADTLWESFTVSSRLKHDGNICEKAWRTLFIISLVLLIKTNWYIVRGPHLHIGWNRDSLRLCLAVMSS